LVATFSGLAIWTRCTGGLFRRTRRRTEESDRGFTTWLPLTWLRWMDRSWTAWWVAQWVHGQSSASLINCN
jgi:hypothetical protein